MRFESCCKRIVFIISLFILLTHLRAQPIPWYKHYFLGLKAMKESRYQEAVRHFQEALQQKSEDTDKIRAYGTVFIPYFPNRELGICLYHLGKKKQAVTYLLRSMRHKPNDKAKKYLIRLRNEGVPLREDESLDKESVPTEEAPTRKEKQTAPESDVGERMSIAVLPFSSSGLGGEMGEVDLLDKLITGFVNCKRFKVVERAQLEKILEEQKLGLSGIIDPNTAAEVGKGIGVDGVILGSVTRARNSLSIDARLIDTENATIISAQDAFSNQISLPQISTMISELADKFKKDLPVVEGVVINIQGEKMTIDIGNEKQVKKGMKCIVYREGDPIVHPVSGKVLGKTINQICEARISEVYPNYSFAEITKIKNGSPLKLDKVVTK